MTDGSTKNSSKKLLQYLKYQQQQQKLRFTLLTKKNKPNLFVAVAILLIKHKDKNNI
jgi:hypothetical protein